MPDIARVYMRAFTSEDGPYEVACERCGLRVEYPDYVSAKRRRDEHNASVH